MNGSALSPRIEAAAYALLRMAYGAVVLTHGIPKVMRLPHGSVGDPFASTANLIQGRLGLPFSAELTVLVTILETAGALMLAAGLCTRAVAVLFVLEMLGISFVMGPAWPWIDRGIEYPVVLGLMAAYFALRGGDCYSFDAWRRSH